MVSIGKAASRNTRLEMQCTHSRSQASCLTLKRLLSCVSCNMAGADSGAGVTAYAAVARASLRPGQSLAIFGCGGVGHLAIQFARAMGLRVVACMSHLDMADSRRTGIFTRSCATARRGSRPNQPRGRPRGECIDHLCRGPDSSRHRSEYHQKARIDLSCGCGEYTW